MATETEEPPERLDAGEHDGRLIVSEHRGRYMWAAQLADGLKALDAGCGTGYGLRILDEAGAARVVGVDISAEAVGQASKLNESERVEILQGDIGQLPFSDGEFNLVVCFEVIEHVDQREAILDELARVLGDDGILCISTPNSRVYPPGNPHHVHEYEPEEFAEALAERFPHVVLHRQTAWLASAILSDAEFAASGSEESFSSRITKTEPTRPGEETFTVAFAAKQERFAPQPVLTLGEPFEVRWWQDQVRAAHAEERELASQEHAEEAAALREQVMNASREAATLRQMKLAAQQNSKRSTQRVLEVEEVLAQLKARIFALEAALEGQTQSTSELHERIERADRVMAAMKASLSWRITAPLRALKRRR
jgi:2-polyprenyl-3-methyl-5-hydroxy-6-metoxy-1,4-benzoquinol methylase